MTAPLRLGVLGTARVARLAVVRPAGRRSDVAVAAVGSRSTERARQFAADHGIEASFGSYEQLVEAPSIDAVYCCCANSAHVRWAEAALRAGKHVLVEKPMCLDEEGFQRIVAASSAASRVALEGVMIQHHPWQGELRRRIDDGELGRLLGCETEICFAISEARLAAMSSAAQGGGVTCDTLPYWLQVLQATAGPFAAPHVGRLEMHGDLDFDVEVSTDVRGAVPARLTASFRRSYRAAHRCTFDGGTIEIPDLFRPNVGDSQLHMKIQRRGATEVEWVRFPAQNYYANQLAAFSALCRTPDGNGSLVDSGARAAALGLVREQLAARRPLGGKPA